MTFKHLFTPGKIGSLEIPNRFVQGSVQTRCADSEGFVRQELVDYHAARSQDVYKRQTYPDRPVTVVLPFGAGSGADRIIRVMLPRMEELLGQKIILDYKTGGGAVVGSNYFMTTKPDGYTLLFYNQPHITMQSTFQKTAYNNDNLVPIFGATWRPDSLNEMCIRDR